MAQEGLLADPEALCPLDAGQTRHHSARERTDTDPGCGGRGRPDQAEEVHCLLPHVSPGCWPHGRGCRLPWEGETLFPWPAPREDA